MAGSDPEQDVEADDVPDNSTDAVSLKELTQIVQKMSALLTEIARDLGYLE